MPCPLIEPDNYPDYIKRILKTIDVGDDKQLKDCACSLRSPLTTEGCPAIDGDGKIGLLPFCVEESEDSKHALWSLEKVMEMYWRVRTWRFTANGVERVYQDPDDGEDYDVPFSTTIEGVTSTDGDGNTITKQEKLVCPAGFYVQYEDGHRGGKEVEIGFNSGTVRPPKKVDDLYDSSIYGYVRDGSGNLEYSFAPERNPQIGTISILGVTLPMSVAFQYGQDDNDIDSDFISVSATLTPTSYWPTLGSNLG